MTQRTLLCTWLVEIYLNKLNQLKDNREVHNELQDEFKNFLAEYKVSIFYLIHPCGVKHTKLANEP